MRRREFIAGLAGTAALPSSALAQQQVKVWRIGFLAGGSRPTSLDGSIYGGFSGQQRRRR
jgi:hypothetical protein